MWLGTSFFFLGPSKNMFTTINQGAVLSVENRNHEASELSYSQANSSIHLSVFGSFRMLLD